MIVLHLWEYGLVLLIAMVFGGNVMNIVRLKEQYKEVPWTKYAEVIIDFFWLALMGIANFN